MANLLSYTFTQPYYQYIENYSYNVIPGTVTLTFDDTPSQNSIDYLVVMTQGILPIPLNITFSPISGNIVFNGNTVTLTMSILADTNVFMEFYYQGVKLNFAIRCTIDKNYGTPSIYVGVLN